MAADTTIHRTAPGAERHRQRLAEEFDRLAADDARRRRQNHTYHRIVESVFRFIVPPGARVLELGCGTGSLLAALEPSRGVGIDLSPAMIDAAREQHPELELSVAAGEDAPIDEAFDYIVCSDVVPYVYDLVRFFRTARRCCHERTRIVVHSYSELWRPVIRLAELLRLKRATPISNWVNAHDVANALDLAGFETISIGRRILMPKKVPIVTTFLNSVVANVWPFSLLTLTWWVVARPRPEARRSPGVSIVVPCRNERGNIAEIVERTPDLPGAVELVFVEGGSSDGTREEVERQVALHSERDIALYVQTGKGKADAVRLGFAEAKHELLLILDADVSVDPEDMATFYDALANGTADFVNGSRLVYAMETGAMQQLNVAGNKLFSRVFTWIIGQPVKDTLCGTKGLWADDYRLIADHRAEIGLLDPFGDFDLLLGAARRGLKIVDIPVRYRARTYGSTNISRFRHGWLLLRMAALAFRAFMARPARV